MVEGAGENLFWEFSLKIYHKPQVEDGLLLMQDRHGLDVNLVLLCCWLGGQGIRLKEKPIKLLLAETVVWRQQIIEPLRHMRRMMKRDMAICGSLPTETVRQHVKTAELEAEKFQQDMLYDKLNRLLGLDARGADRAGLMRINMLTLISATGCESDKGVLRPLLERIITASSQVMGGVEGDGSEG